MKDTPLRTDYVTPDDMISPPVPAKNAAKIIEAFKGHPGLYVHIPFCKSICPFCPYNKVPYDKDLATSYFRALEKEIDCYVEGSHKPFSSLYIGGGTPTLCLDEVGHIIEKLTVTGEIAIEVLPNHATEDTVIRLRDMGVNYLSLGIKSFDQTVLDHLKRPCTATENRAALEAVIGQFDCVDVDLIFDIAFDDETIFLRDLEICFQAGVEQVSSYPLMRFGYTPFGKSGHLPKKEHQVLRKAEFLAKQYGYERRSVWTFNRLSSSSYTSITREFYLGCGAGAATFTGSLFYLNHFSIPAYIEKVNSGSLPIARASRLSTRKAAAYYLFWQAYTGKIDVSSFEALYPGQHLLKGLLNAFRRLGILHTEGDHLVLSKRGYDQYHDLERWVTYHFIEPLWADMMHEHSHLKKRLPPLSLHQRFWLRLAGFSTSQP